MKAYDILYNHNTPGTIRQDGTHGWKGSRPPIKTNQWPLDPNTGYPLQHGFTLLLPKDYQVRGDNIVAISFFGLAPEHFDGSVEIHPGMRDLVLGKRGPTTPDEEKIWAHAQTQHPRIHRFKDILDGEFAIVDLTQEEYDNELADIPNIVTLDIFNNLPKPSFLPKGMDMATLTLKPRSFDPNAGIKPIEWPEEGDAYECHYDDETYELKDWAKSFSQTHLGGTAMPQQGYPDISPYYIEFPEEFGGFNFGTGSAQLCLQTLTFDWACG